MNSGDRLRTPDRPLIPGEAYIDYGPELPGGYGIFKIHALVRDPRCVFAVWEWPSPDRGRAWAVRLRDTENGSTVIARLEEAGARAGTKHFEAQPDRPYVAELGWTDGDAFNVVRGSNPVRTPRDRPSSAVDPEWVPGPGEAEVLKGFAEEIFTPGCLHLRRWGPSHV